MSKETPCIAVCMIDPKTSLCFGCGRTLPEIARWHRMDSAEREVVMALLPARMADAGLVQPARTANPNAGQRTITLSPEARCEPRSACRFRACSDGGRRGRLWRPRPDRAWPQHRLGISAQAGGGPRARR